MNEHRDPEWEHERRGQDRPDAGGGTPRGYDLPGNGADRDGAEAGMRELHRPRFIQGFGGAGTIQKWSIEHPYVVIAFYTAVVVLAILTIGFFMPRRFAPYVESPMVGVITMMP